MHAFFRDEFKKRTNRTWGVGRETFLTFLTPSYIDSLVDLVERWLNNPFAYQVPRLLDALAFSRLGEDVEVVLNRIARSADALRQAYRAIGDLLAFVERADAMDEATRKAVATEVAVVDSGTKRLPSS